MQLLIGTERIATVRTRMGLALVRASAQDPRDTGRHPPLHARSPQRLLEAARSG